MMDIRVKELDLPGVKLISPDIFSDHRGFFYESYSKRRFAQHGIDLDFVQDNHSRSARGVVRGLHYQGPAGAQWRLVRCTIGEIFDVVVDLDLGSATFGRWTGVHLTAENKDQLLIPPAFAHGFTVLSEVAEVQYKCTGFHNGAAERALAWDDPQVGIQWPTTGELVISAKDAAAPSFAAYRDNPDFPAGWTQESARSEENAR
jgi:dTDP-4-dehydrorhamnose 3,5-epimerase